MKKNAHSKSDSSANQEVIDSYDFMSNAASSLGLYRTDPGRTSG